VGGSYPEPTAGWSKITLEWMLLEAEAAGLLVDTQRAAVVLGYAKPVPEQFMPEYVAPDNTMPWHNSLHGGWWVLECIPRKVWSKSGSRWSVALGRSRRQIPQGSWIHESVVKGIDPPKLPDACRLVAWHRYSQRAAGTAS
jgi:hypothetical protein